MSDLKSILPNNATRIERDIEQATAGRLDALQFSISALWSVDENLEDHLPWLAWSVSVDLWKANWPISVKRAMILASFEAHKLKGTRAALDKVLSAMSVRTSVTEWFEDGSAPYTFKIRTYVGEILDPSSEMLLSPAFANQLIELITAIKPLRAHFNLELAARAPRKIGVGGQVQAAGLVRRMVEPVTRKATPSAKLGLAASLHPASLFRVSAQLGVNL